MNPTVFDHTDPQGDRLWVTRPAKGGVCVHVRDKRGGLVEVWLASEVAAGLASVLVGKGQVEPQ